MIGLPITVNAVLLRKTPYQEQDVIAQVFTRQLGKVSLRASSARKNNKRGFQQLDYFYQFEMVLKPTKQADFFVLESLHPEKGYRHIIADLDRFKVAARCCDLVGRTSPPLLANQDLYRLLCYLFRCLDQGSPPDFCTILFAAKLLKVHGLAPLFSLCQSCDRLLEVAEMYEDGELCCPECSAIRVRAMMARSSGKGREIDRRSLKISQHELQLLQSLIKLPPREMIETDYLGKEALSVLLSVMDATIRAAFSLNRIAPFSPNRELK